MYICENCKKTINEKTPSNKVVIATRNKTYPQRPEANRINLAGKIKYHPDPGGTGKEIIKELVVCRTCFEKLKE